MAVDIFRSGQWSDFFLLVGTGAVTLTGLVFVAMSLNVKAITVDATYRNRAINTLTALAPGFMRWRRSYRWVRRIIVPSAPNCLVLLASQRSSLPGVTPRPFGAATVCDSLA